MPSALRDTDATWCSTDILCRALGWSKRRLLHELQNGLPYRTFPPGRTIDWHSPGVELNVAASEVSIFGLSGGTFGMEVMLPTDTPASDASSLAPSPPPLPSPSLASPPASPQKISPAALERCFREIWAERPDDPLTEGEMLDELEKENRLGVRPPRQPVRDLWKNIAPQWKRPRGHPTTKSAG